MFPQQAVDTILWTRQPHSRDVHDYILVFDLEDVALLDLRLAGVGYYADLEVALGGGFLAELVDLAAGAPDEGLGLQLGG